MAVPSAAPPLPAQPQSDASDKSPSEAKTGKLLQKIEAALEPIPSAPLKEQVTKRVLQVFASAEHFAGPMAHPSHMEAYERVCPGLADRIAKMAELAQARQEARADAVLANEYADRRLGMHYGFAALIAVLICGTVITLSGYAHLGGGIITASVLGACVMPFINGRAKPTISKVVGSRLGRKPERAEAK